MQVLLHIVKKNVDIFIELAEGIYSRVYVGTR